MGRVRTQKWRSGGDKCMVVGGLSHFGPSLQLCSATCVDELHPGPPYKQGGPLTVTKKTLSHGRGKDLSFTHPFAGWSGSFYMEPPSPTVSVPGVHNLVGVGTKAFSRALPVHDQLSLGQFLVEVREAPRMIESTWEFFRQFRSSAFSSRSDKYWADAYLNARFGWEPFITELWKLLSLQNKLATRIDWIRKNNGRNVRRSFTISEKESRVMVSSSDTLNLILPSMNTVCYPFGPPNRSHYEDWRHDFERTWFSGCFTFMMPGLEAVPSHNYQLRLKLMGLMPDLHLVYKVTPWTWLIDWFMSTGSVLRNQSLMTRYGQVARYAYVMKSERTIYTRDAHQYVLIGSHLRPVTVLVRLHSATVVERKTRAVANPYGFGMTWDGLSAYQASILAALGITRGRGAL